MTQTGQRLLLVGCGKMGGAMLRGITAARLMTQIVVVKPSAPSPDLQNLPGVVWKNSPDDLDPDFQPEVILIAVKPQNMAELLPVYARFSKAVFLSIAAGIPMAKLAALLKNPAAAIVRTMPNLPASIGQGITGAVASSPVTPEQRALCDKLLSATGQTAWMDDENLLDAVSAISGSGPAYVFALCEAMAKAGEALGLPSAISMQLARQTVIGSGALLAQTAQSPEELRHAVTSPKGTTEAALKHLLGEHGLLLLLHTSTEAAVAHAKELAQQ